jgi:hypothetical protein
MNKTTATVRSSLVAESRHPGENDVAFVELRLAVEKPPACRGIACRILKETA